MQNTRIVHDHRSEFCNAELRAVIKVHDLIYIRTGACHLESNGIVERWNGTVRRESEDQYGDNYLVAQRKVQQLVDEYNNVRLHTALGYFEPRELHFGNPSQRREDRATSYYPHYLNEELEAAAKWPQNQAQPS